MVRQPEVHIIGDAVTVRHGRHALVSAELADVVAELVSGFEHSPSCGVLPRDVRMWRQRDEVVGLVVEIPCHARTIRWLSEDSRSDFGSGAYYANYFLGFPYVELLLVFRRGSLTGMQQLYYRRAPLGEDEELLLPNLYNVAEGYGQRCWVCLVNMRDVGRLHWSAKVEAIVDHLFSSAWNRSSEVHEGNSYWGAMRDLDPRVNSIEAWQDATRANPRFALDIPWKPAGTTATAELRMMLDRVQSELKVSNSTHLAGIVSRAHPKRKRGQ